MKTVGLMPALQHHPQLSLSSGVRTKRDTEFSSHPHPHSMAPQHPSQGGAKQPPKAPTQPTRLWENRKMPSPAPSGLTLVRKSVKGRRGMEAWTLDGQCE